MAVFSVLLHAHRGHHVVVARGVISKAGQTAFAAAFLGLGVRALKNAYLLQINMPLEHMAQMYRDTQNGPDQHGKTNGVVG